MADSNTTTDGSTPEPDETSTQADGPTADAGFEAAAAEEVGAQNAQEEEALDPFTALEIEAAQWKDHALRARADLDNYRKRMAAEKADAIRYANQSLFESLLSVLDNFHFGIDAARTATEPQGVLMGMEMVLKQFEDFLQSQNITAVPAEPGTAFDPQLHEAVAQEHDGQVAEGAIIKVIRNGVRMGERLVRASNVVVSKGPEA